MPTLTLACRKGQNIDVEYTPLIVISGSVTHKLALHQMPEIGNWVVSDPKSGAKVCVVDGQYRGIRVSSRGLSIRDVRQLALASVEALIQRVGTEKFNAVLANPKPF